MRQVPHKKHWPLLAATAIGSGLEYYAYVTFILMAGTLSQVFFNTPQASSNILKILAIFAVAYLMAPLGGIIFGTLGDRYGRKRIFILSIWLMAIAATLIGCLPSYATAGTLGITLLIALRFIQGLAQGAEVSGGMVFVAEHSSPSPPTPLPQRGEGSNRRGLHCGFMFMGIGLGASLATFVNYLLHHWLTNPEILDWGWRLPFLLSIFLGVIAYWLRRKTHESPAFLTQIERPKFALHDLLTTAPRTLLQGMGLVFYGASLITFGGLFPYFLHTAFHYPLHWVYLLFTIALVSNAFLLPVFGWLSDHYGRKRCYGISVAVALILIPVLMSTLQLHSIAWLLVFMLIYHLLMTSIAANYVPMLNELFPTKYRFTGVGAAYTSCFSIAALVPLFATALLQWTDNPYSVLVLLSITGLVSLATLFSLKRCGPSCNHSMTQ